MVAARLSALRRRSLLWRNRDYAWIWSAATVSSLGSQVSLLALPFVAIATLKASTFAVAAVGAVESAPLLLFALPAGAWIDRLRRRPVMIAGDVGRALALGSIPIAHLTGALTIWQLYAVGFVTGTLTVLFDVAAQAFLPAAVAREDLASANATLQVSGSGTRLAGPGLAGLLVGALGASYAVAADALSFLGSAFLLSRVRRDETVAPRLERRPLRREIGEGLAFVLRHPILRPNLAFGATANAFNSILMSVFLLFAVRTLGLSARQAGLVFTLANLGSLAGATLTGRLQHRFGLGRVMLVSAFNGWPLLLIPLASGEWRIPFLAVGLLSWFTGVVIFNSTSAAIRQATTPARLMARVTASNRLVAWGTMLPATLLGGLLGTYLGLRTTVFVGASGRALAGLIILASPVRSIRTLEDADALLAPQPSPVTPQA